MAGVVRPYVVIESFTKEPVELDMKPKVEEPDIGARWGKPAEFEEEERDLSGLEIKIKDTARKYFENEIISLSEVHREFTKGEVLVHPDPIDADTSDWEAWRATASQTDQEEPQTVELEEMNAWTCEPGVTYETQRTKVTVFYRFQTEEQLPFRSFPVPEQGERGKPPSAGAG